MEIIKNDKCEIITVGDDWQVVAFSKDYIENHKTHDIILHYGNMIDDIFNADLLTADIWVFRNGHYIYDFHWYDTILSVRANFRLKRVDFKKTTAHRGGYFYPSTECFCMYDDNSSLKEITKAIREAFKFSRGIEPIEIDEKKDMHIYESIENLVPSRKKKKKEENLVENA